MDYHYQSEPHEDSSEATTAEAGRSGSHREDGDPVRLEVVSGTNATGNDLGKQSLNTTDNASASTANEYNDAERQWGSKFDFIMSCVSYAVGLGNIWRFPFKCYKDGGGAFLIPYLICWAILGVPMFFLETSVGQYLQLSVTGIWNVVPIFRGSGYACVVICAMVVIYYNVILGWAILFLFSSMQGILPWRNCDHYWNTDKCVNESAALDPNITKPSDFETAVTDFWNSFILERSDSLGDSGYISWHLLLAVLLAWIIIYFIVWKGLHSAGKIIWFTAIFPYIIIFILLGKAASLPGASDGIHYYLTPNITMLTEPTVWVDAATQILYSYGIGLATLFALGCYNNYHHNTQRDAFIMGIINAGTSILAGFVVFSSLGFMSKVSNVPIDKVAIPGPGLVFQTYPQVVLEMPISQLWSILFFIMVLLLGVDSNFCQVEGVIAGIEDQLPPVFKRHKKKMTALICFIMFLLAFPMIDQGGIYIFQLMDGMAASGPPMLWVCFWEVIGLTWVFGVKNVYRGLDHMMGYKTWIRFTIYWWGLCWTILIPIICAGIFIFSIIQYEPVTYGDYKYPAWGQALGWLMAASSMALIPGYAIFYLIKTPGTLKQRLIAGITPICELPAEKSQKRHASKQASIVPMSNLHNNSGSDSRIANLEHTNDNKVERF